MKTLLQKNSSQLLIQVFKLMIAEAPFSPGVGLIFVQDFCSFASSRIHLPNKRIKN